MESALTKLKKLQLISDDATELVRYDSKVFRIITILCSNYRENYTRHFYICTYSYFKILLISLKCIAYFFLLLCRLISLELLYNTTTLISMPIYDEMIPNHTNKITRRKNNSVCKSMRGHINILSLIK